MCVEIITIAQCARSSASDEYSSCGKLHLIGKEHVVCKEAHGDCICCFGTCGKIIPEVPTGIALSEISQAPCLACAGGRLKNYKVLESILLDGNGIHDENWDLNLKALQAVWHQKCACPRGIKASTPKDDATVNEPAKEHASGHVDTKPVVDSAAAEASFTEVATDKQGPGQSATTDAPEHVEADPAPAADPWTGAPVDADPVITGKDDMATAVANDNDGDTSIKAGSDAGNVVQGSLDGEAVAEASRDAPKSTDGATPVSRRAVNFAFSAETADKLRDTTEKFAALKTSFLMGKPI
ncbi:hypothetical protein HYE68_008647 [Fusarium pseudograminearum]|nr:hypothetical protein HYE68_008647 [Fusarium pseudograminearum]